MKTRCYALHSNGSRCRNQSVGNYSYYGNEELYSWSSEDSAWPHWVLVPLCKKHRPEGETIHVRRK
jgi:hypothetical protein